MIIGLLNGQPPRNVLLIDFWSDKNRGDAAMQLALLRLARKYAPGAKLTVMAAYGWNQHPAFLRELGETLTVADEVVGGVRPTFAPIRDSGIRNRWARKAAMLLGTAWSMAMAPVWRLVARVAWLRRPLPSRLRATLNAIESADVVIWNGRNFRSDSAAREWYELWQLVYNPNVCFAFRKPVATIGVSIWPLRSERSKRLVGGAIGKTYFASMREQNSLAQAKSIVPAPAAQVVLLPDLSLEVLADGVPDFDQLPPLPARPRTVALTVVDWPNLGQAARDQYIGGLVGAIAHLVKQGTESVTIIPQVTYEIEGTSGVVRALEKAHPGVVFVQEGSPDVLKLADSYTNFDLLIATRMHSAIFATSRGVPVVTIPYDGGGKWGILDMMGVHDVDVPYDQASAERLVGRIEEVWARRAEIRSSVACALPDLLATVEHNVSVPLSAARSA